MPFGKRLKFHTNIQQGLKKLLKGLLDLFFYCVTIISVWAFLHYKFLVSDVTIVLEIDWKLWRRGCSLKQEMKAM